MRCGHNMSTTNSAELIDHGHTQGRAFLGIGSSSHLIEQNQRGSFADFNHARDICDVRSEGGKVCSKRLMIANISEHGSIECNLRFASGNGYAGEGHQREQSSCFENHGLAACVGARDNHRIVLLVE